MNGPIVVFLYGFNAAGVAPHGVLNEGTITERERDRAGRASAHRVRAAWPISTT